MKPGDDNKRQVVLRQQQCHGCGCTFATGSPSVTVCDLCLSLVEDLSALVAQPVERLLVKQMRAGSIPAECAIKMPVDAGKDFKP